VFKKETSYFLVSLGQFIHQWVSIIPSSTSNYGNHPVVEGLYVKHFVESEVLINQVQ
jgi:hypothetical protein